MREFIVIGDNKSGKTGPKRANIRKADHNRNELKKQTLPLSDLVRDTQVDRVASPTDGLASRLMVMTATERRSAAISLQQTHGNRFVQRLALQAKQKVGPAGDKYEQEADKLAQQVMRMPYAARSEKTGSGDEDEVQAKSLASSITPLVQHQEEEEEVQARRGGDLISGSRSNPGGSFEAGSAFESRLSSTRGGGTLLPDELRRRMEAGFGADFTGVRVHTGHEASQLNRAVGAQAFTYGNDIYFSEISSPLGTHAGNSLLAHELVHTIQQGGAREHRVSSCAPSIQRTLDLNNTDWRKTTEIEWKKGAASPENGVVLRFVEGNSNLWVKTTDNASHAVAAATLINAAAKARDDNVGQAAQSGASSWKMLTPQIRAGIPEDVAYMNDQIQQKHNSGKLIAGTAVTQALVDRLKASLLASLSGDRLTVSTHAEGAKMGEDVQGIQDPKARRIFDTDVDFQKTLGYAALLDIIIGNFDRTVGQLAPQNWTVKEKSIMHRKNRMYLFDNIGQGFGWTHDQWINNHYVTIARNHNWEGIANALLGAEGAWSFNQDWQNVPDKNSWKENYKAGMIAAYGDLLQIYKNFDKLVKPTGELTDPRDPTFMLKNRIRHILGLNPLPLGGGAPAAH